MGCDTVGFVRTKEKNPFKIWSVIKASIFEEIKRETGIEDITAVWGKNYTMPSCEIYDFTESMRVTFKFAGEDRMMNVHLTCDSDFSYYKKGKKVIISLGVWGRSVQLVEVVLRGLSEFGDVHMLDNDCSEEWRELK